MATLSTISPDRRSPIGLTELHLHLEGSLAIPSAIDLARQGGHAWGELTPRQLRQRFRYRDFDEFLATIREMCRVLCAPNALERAAHELSVSLAGDGVRYAEVYFSPYIYVRWGLAYGVVMDAVERGFSRAEDRGGASCRILLDAVRHWGVAAAEVVLHEHASRRDARVVGFGLGGQESVPFDEFRDVYHRARDLGLRTLAHAGETGSAQEVRRAVEILGVDRIAHGIQALDDESLVRDLVTSRIPLDLAITSNYRTGVVRGCHPIRELIDRGVVVTLSTDDPSLFRTDPIREYRRARRFGRLSRAELFAVARNGIDHSFADEAMKSEMREELRRRESRVAPASSRPSGGQ